MWTAQSGLKCVPPVGWRCPKTSSVAQSACPLPPDAWCTHGRPPHLCRLLKHSSPSPRNFVRWNFSSAPYSYGLWLLHFCLLCPRGIDEANHLRHGIFGRHRDQNVDMIRHQMTFQYPALFLRSQVFQQFTQMLPEPLIKAFLPVFWYPHHMIFTFPFCML